MSTNIDIYLNEIKTLQQQCRETEQLLEHLRHRLVTTQQLLRTHCVHQYTTVKVWDGHRSDKYVICDICGHEKNDDVNCML